MGRYATAQEVVDRYPLCNNIGIAKIDSGHLVFAENELDGLLGKYFTVPFSSNNLTAKDISIDLAYLRIGNFKVKEREEFRKSVMDRISRLVDGNEAMITSGGEAIYSVGDTIGVSGQNYSPVFGMGNIEDFHVDVDRIIDEANERSPW